MPQKNQIIIVLGVSVAVLGSLTWLGAGSLVVRPVSAQEDTTSAATYLAMAQEVSALAPYGVGPDSTTYRTFQDAIAFGSANCGQYVDEMLQRLALIGVQGDAMSVTGPNNFIIHALVVLDDYVIDPTNGIVYPHSLGELVDDPILAKDYLGNEPVGDLRNYVGQSLFENVNAFTRSVLSQGLSPIQMKATVSVPEGVVEGYALPYWTNGGIDPPATSVAGDITLRLDWTSMERAGFLSLVPDWLSGEARPEAVTISLFDDGQQVFKIEDAQPKTRGGALPYTIPKSIPFDTIEIHLDMPEGQAMVLREIVIDGWSDDAL